MAGGADDDMRLIARPSALGDPPHRRCRGLADHEPGLDDVRAAGGVAVDGEQQLLAGGAADVLEVEVAPNHARPPAACTPCAPSVSSKLAARTVAE